MRGASIWQYLVWVSGLSASLVTPLVLCVLGAYWLQKRFSLPGFVVLFGILFGLAGGAVNLMKFFRFMQKQAEHDKKED